MAPWNQDKDMDISHLASHFRTQQNLAKLYHPSPALSAIEKDLKPSWAMADALKSVYTIADATKSCRGIAAYSHIRGISQIADWLKTSQLQTSTTLSALQAIAGDHNRLSKNLSAISGIGSRFHDSLHLSSAWDLHSRINAAIGASSRLQQRLEEVMGDRNRWIHDLKSFSRVLPKVEADMAQFAADAIAVDDDGSLTVDDQSFSLDEINDKISDIIDEVNTKDDARQSFFELFFNELDKLPRPFKIILIGVLIPFIINVMAGISTPHIQELFKAESNNKQTIVREIKKQTQKHFDMRLLASFRFVTATTLYVREGPSQKTKILDKLVLGQVVYIKYKKKNWTFIGYTDKDTGESYEGWVFIRYIKRFKR